MEEIISLIEEKIAGDIRKEGVGQLQFGGDTLFDLRESCRS